MSDLGLTRQQLKQKSYLAKKGKLTLESKNYVDGNLYNYTNYY